MSTSTRGFASMSKERRRKVAAMGGKRTNELGKGHKWTSDEAKEAGRKGGRISRKPVQVEQLV
jgi:uncharacterized protein